MSEMQQLNLQISQNVDFLNVELVPIVVGGDPLIQTNYAFLNPFN